MNKVNIANYVIYDLAHRLHGVENPITDNEIIDLVAETWHKKHFVSVQNVSKNRYNEKKRQNFII